MTRTCGQILPSGAGELRIDGWQFPKSCPESEARVCAPGAESITANWVLRKQARSDWPKQSNSDRGEPSQPYWRHTPFFWTSCQGNGQPVPFRKVSAVCKSLTLKWKRNSRQTANTEIHTCGMWWGMQQHAHSALFTSHCFYLCACLWHAFSANNSFLNNTHTHTRSENEANHQKMSCHVISLLASLITVSSGIWRGKRDKRSTRSSIVKLKQQVTPAPVTGGRS